MLLIATVLAPLVMFLATSAHGRLGPAAGLSAAVAVLAATLASRAAGPVPGGAVEAFPTTSATLALAAQGKRNDAANVAFGLISSLPCFPAFALTVAIAAPHLGLCSLLIATAITLAAAALTWRHVTTADLHRPSDLRQ